MIHAGLFSWIISAFSHHLRNYLIKDFSLDRWETACMPTMLQMWFHFSNMKGKSVWIDWFNNKMLYITLLTMISSLYWYKLPRDSLFFLNVAIIHLYLNAGIQISQQNVKMSSLYHIPESLQFNRGYIWAALEHVPVRVCF